MNRKLGYDGVSIWVTDSQRFVPDLSFDEETTLTTKNHIQNANFLGFEIRYGHTYVAKVSDPSKTVLRIWKTRIVWLGPADIHSDNVITRFYASQSWTVGVGDTEQQHRLTCIQQRHLQ